MRYARARAPGRCGIRGRQGACPRKASKRGENDDKQARALGWNLLLRRPSSFVGTDASLSIRPSAPLTCRRGSLRGDAAVMHVNARAREGKRGSLCVWSCVCASACEIGELFFSFLKERGRKRKERESCATPQTRFWPLFRAGSPLRARACACTPREQGSTSEGEDRGEDNTGRHSFQEGEELRRRPLLLSPFFLSKRTPCLFTFSLSLPEPERCWCSRGRGLLSKRLENERVREKREFQLFFPFSTREHRRQCASVSKSKEGIIIFALLFLQQR